MSQFRNWDQSFRSCPFPSESTEPIASARPIGAYTSSATSTRRDDDRSSASGRLVFETTTTPAPAAAATVPMEDAQRLVGALARAIFDHQEGCSRPILDQRFFKDPVLAEKWVVKALHGQRVYVSMDSALVPSIGSTVTPTGKKISLECAEGMAAATVSQAIHGS